MNAQGHVRIAFTSRRSVIILSITLPAFPFVGVFLLDSCLSEPVKNTKILLTQALFMGNCRFIVELLNNY